MRPGRFVVLSPDGVPIAPTTYPSREAAARALATWVTRFDGPGFYASTAGPIALDELPERCRIVPANLDDERIWRRHDEAGR